MDSSLSKKFLSKYSRSYIARILEEAKTQFEYMAKAVQDMNLSGKTLAIQYAQYMAYIQSKMSFGLALIVPGMHQQVIVNINLHSLRFVQGLMNGYDLEEILSSAEVLIFEEEINSREQRLQEVQKESERIKQELERKLAETSKLVEAKISKQAQEETQKAKKQLEAEQREKAEILRRETELKKKLQELETMNQNMKKKQHAEELQKKEEKEKPKPQTYAEKLKLEAEAFIASQKIAYQEATKEMKFWFDFGQDQILTLEGIINSCFSNPDRRKYEEDVKRGFSNGYGPFYNQGHNYYKTCGESITASNLLKRLSKQLPQALKKFMAQKIILFDRSRLEIKGVSKEVVKNWVERLKLLAWVGPFEKQNNNRGYNHNQYDQYGIPIKSTEEPNTVKILSRSSLGEYYGFALTIDFQNKSIMLDYQTGQGGSYNAFTFSESKEDSNYQL